MSALGMVQLAVDIAFLFLILLLFLGRGWRRGSAGTVTQEEVEAYREMVSTLTVLVKDMKTTAAEAQERLEAKQVEIDRAIQAADGRLKALNSRPEVPLDRMAPPQARPVVEEYRRVSVVEPVEEAHAAPVLEAPEGERTPMLAHPAVDLPPGGPLQGERSLEEEERERAEKYRQVLEFAEKGWTAIDIARFLQIPRGEVDLLMRTKVRGK